MGFDVTYHPVSELALDHFYFSLLSGHVSVAERCSQYNIDPIFEEKLTDWVRADRLLPTGTCFDSTIGFHAAAAAGIFARFHYLRGSQLSRLPTITQYTKPWQQIAPQCITGLDVSNRITANYMSGVYVPADRIVQLRHDLHNDPALHAAVASEFPGRHLDVLLAAMDEAIQTGVGLLEATDVLEPDPFNLNATIGAANRLNCDLTGPLIYRDTALAQVSHDPEFMNALAQGNVGRVTTITDHGPSSVGEPGLPPAPRQFPAPAHTSFPGQQNRPSTAMALTLACLVVLAVLLTVVPMVMAGSGSDDAPFSDVADCVNIRTPENPFWYCTAKDPATN